MDARSKLFQKLKPCCVDLNDAIIKFRSGKSSPRDVSVRIDALLSLLSTCAHANDVHALDHKLAEYAFFPLSNVLRERQTLTARCVELALRCLTILLETGWRNALDADLGAQLIILLTYLASTDPQDSNASATTEEVRCCAFDCQTAVFRSYALSEKARESLMRVANIPALGHAVTVTLDAIHEVASFALQHAALENLRAFLSCVNNRELLASFLPGITSTLTQVLTPSTKSRTPYKVVRKAMEIISRLFKSVLSDNAIAAPSQQSFENSFVPKLDHSWVKGTSGQVKLALANIIKLRQHERYEVREALHELCLIVLQDCSKALIDAAPMMLETLVSLAQDESNAMIRDNLTQTVMDNAQMTDMLRSSVYSWLISLPRLMLSNDDAAKRKLVGQLATSLSLLKDTGADMLTLDESVLSSLQQSLTSALHGSVGTTPRASSVSESNTNQSLQLITNPDLSSATSFGPALTTRKTYNDAIDLLDPLIAAVSNSKGAPPAAHELLDRAKISEGDDRAISMWLSLQLLQKRRDLDTQVSEFLDLTSPTNEEEGVREDIYAFALTNLTQADNNPGIDWRIQALSLQCIALHARALGHDFRPELVDVLYPVLCLMGASDAELRQHAVVCINVIAESCGYTNARELLISNVDYLVNAVGVKLNAFDISPQAAQVLTMMTRLCGPKLLPYLDDLVDSIFEALEYFHGYPKLVEMLFHVMGAIVEEGVKAPILMLEGVEAPDHKLRPQAPKTVLNVLQTIKKMKATDGADEPETEEVPRPDQAPQKPWAELPNPHKLKDTSSAADLLAAAKPTPDEEDDTDDLEQSPEPKPPSLSQTAKLLHRITLLTQHHLPSSSPTLRSSLLALLTQSLPHLATHEDTFLPTINTLWPVLTPRLHDPEPYIVAGVLDVLSVMTRGGGDFMRTRVEGVWPTIRSIYARTRSADSKVGDAAVRSTSRAERKAQASSIITSKTIPIRGSQPSAITALPHDAIASIARPSRRPAHSSRGGNTAQVQAGESDEVNYNAAPLRALRTSLTAFLIVLVTHVHVSSTVFVEIASQMLREDLLDGGRGDVTEAMRARNPDVVWLMMEQARWDESAESAAQRQSYWTSRKPRNLTDAPMFVDVVF